MRGKIKNSTPSEEQKTELSRLETEVKEARDAQSDIIDNYAKNTPLVKQVIDLALLGNGLLKGKELTEFIRRSVSLL
ncbi:MAG: hypothetical protein K2G40_06605 [Muribaculaceae bacterium]|nr:hypothetical protein [Muribaculaceae bacterium]